VQAPQPTVAPPSARPPVVVAPAAPAVASAPAVTPPAVSVPSVPAPSPSAPSLPARESSSDDEQPDEPASASVEPGAVTLQHVRDAWPEILETVQRTRRSAWAVVYTSHPRALDGDVLTLSFVSRSDVESFRQAAPSGGGTSEVLRSAILSVLGIRVKFLPKVDGGQAAPEAAPAWSGGTADAAPAETPRAPVVTAPSEQRYGESVVREILGASFLEETTVAPSEVG
jgi:DNA polymerase-3 subunit gamma/tau